MITITKIKVSNKITGFWRGYGWEIKDTERKLIIDLRPTKREAIRAKVQYLNSIKPL